MGGAVRDLLLGGVPRELDVVLAADAPALAQELAARLGGEVSGARALRHGPRGAWRGARGRRDRARERYPSPGALPQVRPGTPEEDLERRDFTVNAIAVGLDRGQRGELRARAPRARGSRRAPPARAARAQLQRRPHAAVAPRALPRAPGLRDRGAHRRARARGARGRRAGHRLRRAPRRRAAPCAERAGAARGARRAGRDGCCWRRCTRSCAGTSRSCAARFCGSRRTAASTSCCSPR